MGDIRYQVFVSSTFVDLQEERKEVMQALLELGCIPAGMELFPAADEEQWSLIRRVIDESDYYVVIVGGRYGSVDQDGMGFTEKEYRYALEKGKPTIGFVHRNPDSIEQGKGERTDEGRAKLLGFRELVQRKLVKQWESPSELGSVVSRSMIQLMNQRPAVGWVRGDRIASDSAKDEILRLRDRVRDLEAKAGDQSEKIEIAGLADLEDIVRLRFIATYGYVDSTDITHEVHLEWSELFGAIAPKMTTHVSAGEIESLVEKFIGDRDRDRLRRGGSAPSFFSLNEYDRDTVIVHLEALGLISNETLSGPNGEAVSSWRLTDAGRGQMFELRVARKVFSA